MDENRVPAYGHRRFFARSLPEIGREFAGDMPRVCELLRMVYR